MLAPDGKGSTHFDLRAQVTVKPQTGVPLRIAVRFAPYQAEWTIPEANLKPGAYAKSILPESTVRESTRKTNNGEVADRGAKNRNRGKHPIRSGPGVTIPLPYRNVQRWHIADDAVLVEVVIRGTHLSAWRGLPATGRRVEFPLCGVYTFDGDDLLAGERIYYDRGTVLRQLGVFYEPQKALGQIWILAAHPITILRACEETDSEVIFGGFLRPT